MRDKITNTMLDIGLDASLIGFNYIADAMCMFFEDPMLIYEKKMNLYMHIAERVNKSYVSIERSMRYTFNEFFNRVPEEQYIKYFPMKKHTTSNCLLTLYLRIKNEIGE